MTKTQNYAKTPAHAGDDKSLAALAALEDRIADLERRLATVKGASQPSTVVMEPAPFSFGDVELTEEDIENLTAEPDSEDVLIHVEKPEPFNEILMPAFRHHPDAPPPLPEPDPEPVEEDDSELLQAMAIADIEDVHRRALAEVTTIASSAGLLITFYDFPQFTEGGVE